MRNVKFMAPNGCQSPYIGDKQFECQMIARVHDTLAALGDDTEPSLEVLRNNAGDTFAAVVVRNDGTAVVLLVVLPLELVNVTGLLRGLGCDDYSICMIFDDIISTLVGLPDVGLDCFDDIHAFLPEWN